MFFTSHMPHIAPTGTSPRPRHPCQMKYAHASGCVLSIQHICVRASRQAVACVGTEGVRFFAGSLFLPLYLGAHLTYFSCCRANQMPSVRSEIRFVNSGPSAARAWQTASRREGSPHLIPAYHVPASTMGVFLCAGAPSYYKPLPRLFPLVSAGATLCPPTLPSLPNTSALPQVWLHILP